MAISQDTILNLSKRIRSLLEDGDFEGTKKSIERIKEAKENRIEENRLRPGKIKKLRKKLQSGELTKKEAKEEFAKLSELETEYKPPEDLQNIIEKQEGDPFHFNVRLSGFTTTLWGKKRSILKIGSKEFKDKQIGTVERRILIHWARALEEYIEEVDEDKQREGLEGILQSVLAHIEVLDGEISAEELDEYLRAKELYPILVYIDPALATIKVFAASKKSKSKKKK